MTTATFTPNRREGIAGARSAGLFAILAALVMLTGTAFWAASGTDLDSAVESGEIAGYLTAAAANGTLVTLNLVFWIAGVVLLGVAGTLLSRLGDRDGAAATVARFAFSAGPAAALVFFSLMLAIVLELAPAHGAGQPVETIALVLGQAATLADWLATVVILSLGAGAVVLSGRGSWAPTWLQRWAGLSAVAGALAITGLFLDQRATLAMPIVPIGVGLMIAAGVVALRRGR
jgi:hypothetical protein